ncbi:MAG: ORF6N domain-containing protein [Bacteroidales bacterium]|nr:ORF6N domain-containing protein [Bacteroidales bacterium]MDY0215898.1 ORF6N domain-containing protein [Bacteroidales bacterium]
MNPNESVVNTKKVQDKIFTIRGLQVILDSDLAEMYQVPTGRINEQVKRNKERFPDDFMFQLTEEEWVNLKSQNAISSWGGRRTLPFVFTEQGVSSLSGILKSDVAINVYINIIRAFVEMRKFMIHNASVFQRIENVEQKQLQSDLKIDHILSALEEKTLTPKQGIYFNGQIFDAWVFASELVKSAEKSIVLIDNYIDESVLNLLLKRKKNVDVKIYTANFTPALKTDLEKHNRQYMPIEIKVYKNAHDRFLIIDQKQVYHIGASLKDLGKKLFGFSKMQMDAGLILKIITGIK